MLPMRLASICWRTVTHEKGFGAPRGYLGGCPKEAFCSCCHRRSTLRELAEGSAFGGADALVITGAATGHSTDLKDVRAAASAGLPVVIGSGVTSSNVSQYADVMCGHRWVGLKSRRRLETGCVRRVQAIRKA